MRDTIRLQLPALDEPPGLRRTIGCGPRIEESGLQVDRNNRKSFEGRDQRRRSY